MLRESSRIMRVSMYVRRVSSSEGVAVDDENEFVQTIVDYR